MAILSRVARGLALALASLILASCQFTYLVKSAYNQADLLRRRVPMDEALRDPQISEEEKRKLRLAVEAREFAEKRLQLKPTQNYTSYVKLDRPYVSYVVSAAPKSELKHYLWKYPIVGELPYKGFATPEEAKAEADQLQAQGLDTYVRGVSAFSTLGWFKDPLLSSMLRYSDHDLVNTIIHETVHATIYIKSAADFNERLAVFIGNKGTEMFYGEREGVGSATLKLIEDENWDEAQFSEFISREIDALKTWYQQNQSAPDLEQQRQAQFKAIQTRFEQTLAPRLKTKSYRDFAKVELNNARLLTYKLYVSDLSDFARAYQALGSDIPRMVQFCKSLEKEKYPERYLKGYKF